MIRGARGTAALLALAVLGWQAWNARQGRFVHLFLVSDIVVALLLLVGSAWLAERTAAALMMAGLSALAGVFLSATTGRLVLRQPLDGGTVLTALGLVPCVAVAAGLARWLVREGAGGRADG